MTTGRFRRRNASFRPTGERRTDRENNFFLGMVGFSLFVHVIIAAISLHTPTPRIKRRPPMVYVDLVTTPVANPQRGNAGAVRKVAAPVAVPSPPVVPSKATKEPVVVKAKETKKTAPPKDDLDVAAEIAKMKQRKAARDELNDAQAAIANMKKKAIPTQQAAAAVGSASGTGGEAGAAIDAWLQKEVKAKWNWPGRKRKDLSAEIEVEFDAMGKLSNYRFIRSSGEALFDKSLKDALLKLGTLPKTMREPYKETILFNLDDLQGQ